MHMRHIIYSGLSKWDTRNFLGPPYIVVNFRTVDQGGVFSKPAMLGLNLGVLGRVQFSLCLLIRCRVMTKHKTDEGSF
jgi:hypothetical protein